jgi:DNA-binding IclR family transcriptional regulator
MLEGIKAVSVPLLYKAGDIQACIAVRGPAHRMTPQRVSSWVEELVIYAKECSRELKI